MSALSHFLHFRLSEGRLYQHLYRRCFPLEAFHPLLLPPRARQRAPPFGRHFSLTPKAY